MMPISAFGMRFRRTGLSPSDPCGGQAAGRRTLSPAGQAGGWVQRGGDILPPYGEPHRHSPADQRPCPHPAAVVFPLWAALPSEGQFAIKGRPRMGLPASISEIPLSAEKAAVPAQGSSLAGGGHQV